MSFQTEFPFTLQRGYVDENANLHKEGIMRLATAADEILPAKDPRVNANPAYLTIIVLARVVTKLGSLPSINTKVIESLFVSDLAYLKKFYDKINVDGNLKIHATCPKCENKFETEMESLE
jgi:hypothetical protein